MKVDCVKCNGRGFIECFHCGHDGGCPICAGAGEVNECLSEMHLPKTLKNYGQISLLQQDAQRCVRDHARISILNPSYKLRYDEQLAETLNNLEAEAKTLSEL